MGKHWRTLTDPIIRNNPITVQILGICSALAVTTKLSTALTMAAAVVFVAGVSSTLISLIRNWIPGSIRMIVQMTVIASAVITWVNPDPMNPIVRALRGLTEPAYRQIRRVIPTNFGGLDIAPMLLILAILFLQEVVIRSLKGWMVAS